MSKKPRPFESIGKMADDREELRARECPLKRPFAKCRFRAVGETCLELMCPYPNGISGTDGVKV